MNERKCFCFGAGEFFGLVEKPDGDSLIIAADGGLCYVNESGLNADFIIGDFDSLGKCPKGENVTVLPVEKDTTDMLEAVKKGEEAGISRFIIYGGTGGRPDHTLANIQLLGDMSSRRLSAVMYGKDYAFTAVTDGSLSLNGKIGDTVSVFSLSDRSDGVSLKGLRYPLENGTLTNRFALGVSNELSGEKAEISVKKGTLLICYKF